MLRLSTSQVVPPPPQLTGELQSVAVVRVENRQFLIPAGLLRQHCPALAPALRSNAPLIRVNIDGMKSQTFKLIESYIRVGQLPDVTVQNSIDLYTAAINLGMQRLATKCHERIYTSCMEDQALIYYIECQRNHSSVDLTAALNYIGKTFRMISLSKGITELSEEQLIKLIESAPVKQRPQSERFTAVLRWLQADCRLRRDRARSLLSRFDLSDTALLGCEVCPEISKQVPALKILSRASTLSLKSETVPLPLPKDLDTKSFTSTDRRGLVATISGGSTLNSPLSADTLSRTSLKRAPTLKVAAPKVRTGSGKSPSLSKAKTTSTLTKSRSSSFTSELSTVDIEFQKLPANEVVKPPPKPLVFKKATADKAKPPSPTGVKGKDAKKSPEANRASVDKSKKSVQEKTELKKSPPVDLKKVVEAKKKKSSENLPRVATPPKDKASPVGLKQGVRVVCDGTFSKTESSALPKSSSDANKMPDEKLSPKTDKKPSGEKSASQGKKSPDKKDDKRPSGDKPPGEHKKPPADKPPSDAKKSPPKEAKKPPVDGPPSRGKTLASPNDKPASEPKQSPGKKAVLEEDKKQADNARAKLKNASVDKPAQVVKPLEGGGKQKNHGNKALQAKKVPIEPKNKPVKDLKAPPVVSPLPDSVKLKPADKPVEAPKPQKRLAAKKATASPPKSPEGREVFEKKLDPQYSEKRMHKLAEAKAKLFLAEPEHKPAEVGTDGGRRRGAARFYREEEEAKKDTPNDIITDNSVEKFQQVVQRTPRKTLIKWPKLRTGRRTPKQKVKGLGIQGRSKRLWMSLKKEAMVLTGGKTIENDEQ